MTSAQHATKEKLKQIATEYEKAYFDRFPELAAYWRYPGASHDKFRDHSLAATEAWHAKEDQFLSRLLQLNEADLKNHPEHLTYSLLKENLQNTIAVRSCRDELWYIDPLFGWHNIMAIMAEKQPTETEQHRAWSLQRWQAFGKVVQDEIQNLREGIKQGYTAPKPVVQRVLNQLQVMMNTAIEDSPFYTFAKGSAPSEYKKQVAAIIESVVNPSLKRYTQFLQEEYLPKARETVGLCHIANGRDCYQAKLKKETTLDITPEEIHQFGLEYMAQLIEEIKAIGSREFGKTDIVEIFWQAKHDPKYLFTSEKHILDYNFAALERAKAQVGKWFDWMPQAEGTIKPYPLHRALTGAAGEYHPPSEEFNLPGIFYINTYQAEKRSRIDHEATLFHELIPGHHLQVALEYENKNQHSLNKYLWNPGYGEGWALYVERLSDEMGLYSEEIARLGMLSNEALRAARLVVDTGLHAFNWSREQAIDYLKRHTAVDDNIIGGEVDRYIMLPGQATSYMLGKREIERLRELSKNQLGKEFDIRQFHNQILKNGSVTLPMLRKQIEAWLEEG